MHYKYIRMPSLSAEQAWALIEFIWQLEELVQDTYQEQLRDLIGPEPPEPPDNLDDDIPF